MYLEGTSDHEAIIGPVHATSNAVGINTGIQRELHRRRVDNTYNIAASWGLNNSKEWAVKTVFCVKLYYLLVVIGALQQFDSAVKTI